MQEKKRILKIALRRVPDPNPDISFLGNYSDTAENEFSIDRRHAPDCPVNVMQLDADDGGDVETHCTCDGRNLARGQYRYFNPGTVEPFNPAADWYPAGVTDKRAAWEKLMRVNARIDYERMEAFKREEWGCMGVSATAHISIDGISQTVSSGGLWGVTTDSEETYLREIEKDELHSLRRILRILGFSRRAIAAAVKAIN